MQNRYQTRIRATFTALMSLEKFPFDRQCLSICMESGAHEAHEVMLIPYQTKLHLYTGVEKEWFGGVANLFLVRSF